ncbi:M56 family metallopeptidase [Pontibacter korlensis]|uniref:TonB C-terminal domain-containing protein n=1 Tax=Pontibacter korlensis TaxID=400092 RepID=A0A0E3UUM1_9BACT|nr:M56 family metallopeptidase [Pontibacter korlensis]AKD01877.1 hypothetical protein PKOR_00305 [Pontibacter korlensis]
MEALLNYIFKAAIGLLALYLFHFLVLRRHNNFGFNRLYLLAAPVLALLLPLLVWPAWLSPDVAVTRTLHSVQLGEFTVKADSPQKLEMTALTLQTSFVALYLLGFSLVLLRLVRQIWQIRQLKHQSTPLPFIEEDAQLYQLNSHYPAFAFGSSIFLSLQQEQLSTSEQKQVIAHELAHVKYGHTWDVLFYEVLSAILWFHPVVWLLKQELRDVHEYQADAAVVSEYQTQKYTSLLSREALLSMGLPVGSHFTKPQVIKRLHMLQLQGQKPGWLRPLLTLPLLVGLSFILARQQVTANSTSTKTESAYKAVKPAMPKEALPETEEPAPTPEKDQPYAYVEQMPVFEGGEIEMMKFLGQNIRYPEQAKESETEGLVVLGFVVEKDGSLHDIAVIKSLGSGTDEEAIRVVKMMDGKWSPGRQNGQPVSVRYTMPIRFAIR